MKPGRCEMGPFVLLAEFDCKAIPNPAFTGLRKAGSENLPKGGKGSGLSRSSAKKPTGEAQKDTSTSKKTRSKRRRG